MKKVSIFILPLIVFSVFVFNFSVLKSNAAIPSDFGLKEGDLISAIFSDDPDVYIINEHGYKRLFLNPEIFKFYSHLGGFANIKLVTPEIRDSFPTSGFFRNCEDNDQKVFGTSVEGEDNGRLHWINKSGDQAVQEDPDFFKKVFCINRREFNWYPRGIEFKALKEVPQYHRTEEAEKPVICHHPSDQSNEPKNLQTIRVAPESLDAHFQHGDTKGACSTYVLPTLTPQPVPTPTSTPITSIPPTPILTPAPTASFSFSPTPTPILTPSPTVSSLFTPTPTPVSTPSTSSEPASSPQATPTPTPTPSSTPTYNVLFPVISSVFVSSITSNSAVISWTTNVPAYGTYTYGPSVLNTLGPQDITPITQHSFTVSGLTANAVYYYKVFSFNSYGYDSDAGGPGPQPVRTFTTLSTTLSTPLSTPSPTPMALAAPASVTASIDPIKKIIVVNWSGTAPKFVAHRSINGSAYQSYVSTGGYTFNNNNPVSGSTYRYKVFSCDSAWSNCINGTESNIITFSSIPIITSLSPTSGPNGTVITLTGSGFYNPSSPYNRDNLCFVNLGGGGCASAQTTATSDTSIEFTVLSSDYLPDLRTYNLRLTTYLGTTNLSQTFTLTTPTPTSTTSSVSFDNFSRDLAVGSRGNDVKQLQALLVNEVGYSADLITGYFGRITRDAVKKLQEKYGVKPVSGYFGGITRRALNAVISSQ